MRKPWRLPPEPGQPGARPVYWRVSTHRLARKAAAAGPYMTSTPHDRPTLGVAIIALNAQARLEHCLAALSFADEIVLVDGGSTDATAAIAAAHGARVIVEPIWPGFGPQKNRAVAELGTDWVLSIDTDEIVTPELVASIRAAVAAAGGPDVYALDRLSNFCGRWMRHGGWYPDWVPRLFKRGSARFSDDLVHERLVFDAQPGRLEGKLLHHSYDDLESVLHKLDAYSSAGARQRHARGKRGSLRLALAHGVWAFLRTYVVRRGFLDGRMGFILAVANAEGTYYRYLKLMLMTEHRPPTPRQYS